MGLGIPPLSIKIMLESNPLKSIMLVRRLEVLKLVEIEGVLIYCVIGQVEFDHRAKAGAEVSCVVLVRTNEILAEAGQQKHARSRWRDRPRARGAAHPLVLIAISTNSY